MDEHADAASTRAADLLRHDGATAPAPAATEERDESESVDLEGWALVDDHAEVIGVEPKSTVSDAVAHTADDAPASAESVDATEPRTHEAAEQQAGGSSSRATDTVARQHTPHTEASAAPVACDASPASASASAETVSVPAGSLRIRLRVGEHVRPAWCKATQTVDDFIAEFFADAVAQGKKVRLIYMGMLLTPGRAMGEYGVEDDGVIHCVVTEAPHAPHTQAMPPAVLKGLSNPTSMLLLVTGVALYGLWTLLYHFPHLFSWKSIVLLSLFSAAHISATLSRFSSSAAPSS